MVNSIKCSHYHTIFVCAHYILLGICSNRTRNQARGLNLEQYISPSVWLPRLCHELFVFISFTSNFETGYQYYLSFKRTGLDKIVLLTPDMWSISRMRHILARKCHNLSVPQMRNGMCFTKPKCSRLFSYIITQALLLGDLYSWWCLNSPNTHTLESYSLGKGNLYRSETL